MSRCLILLPIMAAFAFVGPDTARGRNAVEESDEFFKSDKILTLEIEIGPKEMDALRRDPRKYAKAQLKEDGKIVGRDVGVHVKGAAGSFRGIDDKPGLTINMDKYDVAQRFRGMDKFHLANSIQDGSYIAELICGELMRAAGVPASRVHHAQVLINGKKKGLYYLKEGYDRYFLKRHFGNRDGNFYDGGFLRDIDQPLQLLSTEKDVKVHTDLQALVKATREPNPDKRFEQLDKLLEMDKFLAYLALEAILWDWDGYPMNRNNYRVYHDPKKDKITFIPSGMDQMLGDPRGPIAPGFQGMVARAVMETPEGKKRYFEKLGDLLKNVFVAEPLLKRLDELEARLTPVITAIDAGQGRDYKNQVNRLRDAIKVRTKNAAEQLAKIKK